MSSPGGLAQVSPILCGSAGVACLLLPNATESATTAQSRDTKLLNGLKVPACFLKRPTRVYSVRGRAAADQHLSATMAFWHISYGLGSCVLIFLNELSLLIFSSRALKSAGAPQSPLRLR